MLVRAFHKLLRLRREAYLAETDYQIMPTEINFKTRNYFETLVFNRIRSLAGALANGDDFANDVACIALNRIKPRYVREEIYLLFHLADSEWDAMNTEVAEAVDFAVSYIQQQVAHDRIPE